MKKISKTKFGAVLLIMAVLSAYALWVLTLVDDGASLNDALVKGLWITGLFLVLVSIIGVGLIWVVDKFVEE